MDFAALDPALLGPPLVAGLLVLATHIPLGRRVLTRGIVFLDLAVAQFAGLGVIAAHVAGWETAWATQLTAFLAALAGAGLLAGCDRRWPARQEALIGSSFVVAACAASLLLASDPHGGEELQNLLVGQILWVGNAQLAATAGLYALIALLWRPLAAVRNGHGGAGFYALFALAITASVQLVGVYLVFASLILPALATIERERRWMAAALIVGILGYAGGLLLSALTDLPSGPLIVCALAAFALLAAVPARVAANLRQR
jgi:zinc/manganese transport system permease protein